MRISDESQLASSLRVAEATSRGNRQANGPECPVCVT